MAMTVANSAMWLLSLTRHCAREITLQFRVEMTDALLLFGQDRPFVAGAFHAFLHIGKKRCILIEQLAQSLSFYGVPDTVAYITRNEVFSTTKKLHKLGYREKNLHFAFSNTHQPVSFVYSHFHK